MSDQPQSVRKEFLDALEILSLKKIANTAWSFLKQPKVVVDSISEGKSDFTKPIKYLLAIGTPIIILLNFSGLDVGDWDSTSIISRHLTDADPIERLKFQLLGPYFKKLTNLTSGEFSPIFYLFTVPLLALVTKLFYKSQKRPIYYYLSIGYYIAGFSCLLDLLMALTGSLFYLNDYWLGLSKVSIDFMMLIYFYSKILPGTIFIKTLKSISIILVVYGTCFLLLLSIFSVFIFPKISEEINLRYKPLSLGALYEPVSDSLISAYQLKTARGVLVIGVIPESPAAKSGIKEGDVITKMKNIPTDEERDRRIAMDSLNAGDTIDVLVNRNGEEMQFRITVTHFDSLINNPKVLMGFRREFIQNKFNTNGYRSGSRIIEITKNSPAERSKLNIGDIIVRVDNDTIKTLMDNLIPFIRVSMKNPGDTTRLSVVRAEKYIEVFVIMEKASKLKKKE